MASSWILFAIYLLTSLTTPVNGTHQQYKRSELFKLGENASLSCINKTWNQIIYILWRVSMNGVNCSITKEAHGPVYSSCSNRVTLYNKTSGESQLHIAHFQLSDEGTYHCEVAYNHGNYLLMIAVNAIVSPVLSAQLYSNGSHRFAVCSAHGGKPAANVSWEVWWSSPTITVQVRSEADTSSNITAWLELPDNVTRGNISCIATHTSWLDRRSVTLNLNEKQPSNVIVLLCTVGVTLGSGLLLLIATKFLYNMRKMRICSKSNLSQNTDSKSAQSQEVEEVEPYASYVQRVNSIYNSSADLYGS
ncbi:cell surface glycoprotein CD200 receptor 1-A isoform X2 [Denticeps clupeoides]|uniref:cell surface glycoprotein CD200 receptor 1-A isoform X2 n=1 Tax=Denticeps clupeoides TaxID=299321 RepID=UPI0010A3667D|nr:cell surface glycoprotein CD200 receptor 1-A-like isoform X2 [Denticeps clupeoides]